MPQKEGVRREHAGTSVMYVPERLYLPRPETPSLRRRRQYVQVEVSHAGDVMYQGKTYKTET